MFGKMGIVKCLVVLLIISTKLVTSSKAVEISKNLSIQQNSKLPKVICDAVKDVFSKDRQISTVSMAIFKNNFKSNLVDETLKCLPKRLSVTITDFRSEKLNVGFNDRKASIVVMIADELNIVEFNNIMSDQKLSSALNHMAKFLIVTSDRNSKIGQVASTLFPQVGIINFGIFYEDDKEVYAKVSNHFTNITTVFNTQFLANSTKKNPWKGISDMIFPDKLKNLNGYAYKIAYHHQMSFAHVLGEKQKLFAKNRFFFETVAELQNASSKFILIKTGDIDIIKREMNNLIENGKFDATISESVLFDQEASKISTYDRNALCVIVPNRMNFETLGIELVYYSRHFSARLTVFTLCSSLVLIWWLYRERGAVDSPVKILFAVFGYFTGQYVRVSRNNRRVLMILFQTTIMMLFFVKNYFECHITSITIGKGNAENFETTEDIFQYKGFKATILTGSERLLENGVSWSSSQLDEYFTNKIVLMKCDNLDHYIRASKANSHYMLPHRFSSYFIKLDVPLLSPFAERLQEIMNRAFDHGLTQKWEVLYLTELFGSKNGDLKLYEKNNDYPQYLTFKDLKRPFAGILCAYAVTIVVFLCEIFWHGFISNLSWTLVLRIFRCRQKNEPRRWESIGRMRRMLHFWRQRRTMNVRRIQVRPINESVV